MATNAERLDEIGIEVICDRIANGESQRSIAAELGINVTCFVAWLAKDPNRSARAREARRLSAEYWERQVDSVLDNANDASPGAVAIARERVQHYRWRAKTHNPQDYGDRQVLAGDPNAPLNPPQKVDLSKLTDAELQAYVALQKKLEGGA